MTPSKPLINEDAFNAILQTRILGVIVGVALGFGFFSVSGEMPIPVLMPALFFLAGPEISTGWWLFRQR